MSTCWERRGCDEAMAATCPHAAPGAWSPCPLDCMFTTCDRPQHIDASGNFDLMLDPTVDRRAAQKLVCCTCENFLRHGPRLTG